MPLDREMRAYLDAQAALGLKPIYEMSVADARRLAEERAPLRYAVVEAVGSVRDIRVPGPAGAIGVRIYAPESEAPLPVLVYFHGGGWVTGSLDTHDGLCRSLARRTPCVVAAVDYRLAPEHPFPAAVDDAWAATTWAAAQAREIGGRTDRLAVGGDSAGGNLAAVTALRAGRHGGPALSLQLMLCPVIDHEFARPSYDRCAEGYGLTRRAMQWYWDQYVPDPARRGDPDASPLRTPYFRGTAPAAVLTCEFDPLLDEGDDYARRLGEAGVPTVHRRYDGLIHGAVGMPSITPRAWEMIDESASVLREAFERGP
jgi:acetyl esterase